MNLNTSLVMQRLINRYDNGENSTELRQQLSNAITLTVADFHGVKIPQSLGKDAFSNDDTELQNGVEWLRRRLQRNEINSCA